MSIRSLFVESCLVFEPYPVAGPHIFHRNSLQESASRRGVIGKARGTRQPQKEYAKWEPEKLKGWLEGETQTQYQQLESQPVETDHPARGSIDIEPKDQSDRGDLNEGKHQMIVCPAIRSCEDRAAKNWRQIAAPLNPLLQ
jgi:hypothetical protein